MENTKIITYDGFELNVFSAQVTRPKLNIIFIHGYTDHSGRYKELKKRMNNAGYSITFYDQRGHGISGGKKGYVSDFDHYCKDLTLVINKFSRKGVPNILMGVSMGGCILSKYLIDHGEGIISGAVLLSPMLKISDNVAPFLRRISKILALITPRLKTIKLESSALSRNKEVVKNYQNDPLVYHEGAIVKTGVEMLKAIGYVKRNFHKITLPVLVMHGTDDRLTDNKGSKYFVDHVISKDKLYLEYPGLYHELLNEPEKDQVYEDLLAWLSNEDRWINADMGTEIA
jgi:alpha-beta hydrolase superfamily lysophospholipase